MSDSGVTYSGGVTFSTVRGCGVHHPHDSHRWVAPNGLTRMWSDCPGSTCDCETAAVSSLASLATTIIRLERERNAANVRIAAVRVIADDLATRFQYEGASPRSIVARLRAAVGVADTKETNDE